MADETKAPAEVRMLSVEDEAHNLVVAIIEAYFAKGGRFGGPYEDFGDAIEPAVIDAIGRARRDGAQIANAAAIRACPAESAGVVTLSKAEHRRLLVRAGERPDGMFVRIAGRTRGLHPREVHVTFVTETGTARCLLSDRSIIAGHVGVGWPVDAKPGFLLVELPRECDDGRWRIWVPESSVTSEPEDARIRALSDQPGGRHAER